MLIKGMGNLTGHSAPLRLRGEDLTAESQRRGASAERFSVAVCLVLLLAATARAEESLRRRSAADENHSDQIQSLAGPWQVRLDPKAVGDSQGWFDRQLDEATIQLPGTTDLAGLGDPLDPKTMNYPVELLQPQWPSSQPVRRMDEAGHLVRQQVFLGQAWYQRKITIPEDWSGKHIQLRLERALWQTRAWLDGRPVGSCDSLATQHRYDLGLLSPGDHQLTICVDNRMIHNIGIYGHSYGPETQSRWNGLVGRLELIATDPVYLCHVEINPAADRRSLHVKLEVRNLTTATLDARLALKVLGESGKHSLGSRQNEMTLTPGRQTVETNVSIDHPVSAWDEFSTVRYRLLADLQAERYRHQSVESFGFRHVKRDGRQIRVNDRPIFLRGTLDCCVYPRTGHPPMTVAEWTRVLQTIKDHGFNHVRFHTWCPPEAAFEAADRLGVYLQPETAYWVDDWGTSRTSRPAAPGRDPVVLKFVRNEVHRILRTYGNHPSFVLFCVGNEFGMQGTDWDKMEQIVAEAKRKDPRRLYTTTAARRWTSADDFWVTHHTGVSSTRGVGPPHTNWDFGKAVDSTGLPIVAHETGQRPVFPVYDQLLPKFDGPLRPHNYERLHQQLKAVRLDGCILDFQRASARFQLVQYKAEHEAMLRTAHLAGYQLLMLNDFTGQSEALVGILDPFWESKGIVDAADVRAWNCQTVPLARFNRYVWSTQEDFVAELEVAHFGPDNQQNVVAQWTLTDDDGRSLAGGQFPPLELTTGGITPLGHIRVPLAQLQQAEKMSLSVVTGDARNSWNLWAYPSPSPNPPEHNVLVANQWGERVERALGAGRNVLLVAHDLKKPHCSRTGFLSVYWSAGWWGNRFSSLGVMCNPAHPALAQFPNDGHSDWQWFDLLEGATTFDLTDLLDDVQPIVQPVTDFHHNRRLAHVFQVSIGPGRLLVCGYDLNSQLDKRLAARQFRQSLLQYLADSTGRPAVSVSLEQARQLFAP